MPKRQPVIIIKLGFLIGLSIFVLFLIGLFEYPELGTLDIRHWIRGESSPNPKIVMVVITHRCLAELGNFPWPRDYHARLIDFLKSAGAKVIAFDIFFSHPSQDPKPDEELAHAIKEAGNVILPVFTPYRISKIPPEGNFIPVDNLIGSIAIIQEGALSQGHINIYADIDGIYRKIPVAIRYGERVYNSLGMEAALKFMDIPPEAVEWKQDYLKIDSRAIPLERSKFTYINFSDIETQSPRYAYSDVIKGLMPKESFKGKLVIVGQAAAGLPNADIVQTPFKEKYGVTVQANIANTFLNNFYLKRLPKGLTGIYIIISCILMVALTVAVKTWGSCVLSLLFFTAVSLLTTHLFTTKGIILDFVPLASSILFSFSTGILYRIRFADRMIKVKELELDSILEAGKLTTAGLQTGRTSDIIMATIIGAVGTRGLILRWRNTRTKNIEKAFIYGLGQALLDGPFCAAEEALVKETAADRKAFLIQDISRDKRFCKVTKSVPIHSVICLPLVLKGEVVGSLTLLDKLVQGQPNITSFDNEDLKLVAILAQQTTIALENARLFEEVKSLFLASIRSLAETIDAKDPCTRGHSERVTAASVAIAEELNLSEEQRNQIMIGAILHDVGKIGIKDTILSKPAPLTDEEKQIFDKHPAIGAKIMNPIEEMEPMIPIIRHHHERFDGKGYPDGLEGDEVPLGARIVAAADSYDAMTSDRPYRKALSDRVALDELKKLSGEQFDPKVIEAFNTAYKKGRVKRGG